MVSADRMAAYTATSFLLIVVPGPSVLFVIGRALAHGRRTALMSVAGNTAGMYVLVVAVAFGVGAVVEGSVLVFTALKLAGAAYLVFLGLRAWRRRGALRVDAAAVRQPRRGAVRTLWEGFAVGVTNPKTIVFFAAVLPQFVDREAGGVPAQMLVLGLVFSAVALVCDSAWGIIASSARSWFGGSPRRLSVLGGAGGLAMIGLGLTVVATGRAD